MIKVKFKKGQIIQNKGELNTKIYKVEKGLLRSYSIDKKGKEHIFMFAPEGWIIADSISEKEPCDLLIDALEDTIATIIEKDKEEDRDVFKFIKRLKVLQKRIIMLMSATAIERYEDFVETYPNITQRVPQRMIASYLGITPEALSKVKGERRKKIT